MPKSLQLNIAEPCHENWQNMTPQDQGRFCGACQKTVVDFTVMSDQAVLNYFLKADHNVCGRFAHDQLNKELIITKKQKRFSWVYVWNILVATFLVARADAQVKPKPETPVESIDHLPKKIGKVAYVRPDGGEVVINGNVVDGSNNKPVVGANIGIKGTDNGTVANNEGKFNIKVEKKEGVVLEFSCIGYETQTLEVNKLTNLQDVPVTLKPSFASLEAVSVIAYGTTTGRFTMGGATRIVKPTRLEKIKSNVNDWVQKKDVKIYPNPVVRGNSLTVNLSLKQAGAYKLEILNAAGQVMQVQPLLMQTKEQVIDLHTQVAWSAGVYWLRISSPGTKNVYQSKLLVR
jgi:hypothetical protein